MSFRKIIHWAFIILLVVFAAVQYNDPDGWLWILIYLLTAFLAYRSLQNKSDRISYLAIATLFSLWGINIFPPQWEGVMLDALGMKTLNIELGRESLGLFICSLVIFTCALWE